MMKLESLNSPRFTQPIDTSMMARIVGGAEGEGATSGGNATVYGKKVKFDSDFRGIDSRGKFYMEYRLDVTFVKAASFHLIFQRKTSKNCQ